MTATGDSMRLEQAARRRLNDFERKYGKEALHLAYHAALPVALNTDLLHLLRINFFLDPPESLLYTAEADLLFAPFCHEIGEGLYEIDAKTRDLLLQGLAEEYGPERIREVATLLWQYNENSSPWADRTGLQRAQQVTALNFLDPSKARQWLAEAETWVGQGPSTEREWFVAMSKEIERGRETLSFAYEERQGERGVPIPAILIAGPPHAGKSVLAYSLTQALRGRGVLHHLLRAAPDGEGNWMQDADQETIRLFRVKGSWTETFVEGICRDIERRQYPLLVDLGGRPGEAQIPILRRCTHALLLFRSDQEESPHYWDDLVEREGLLPIAQIYSALNGPSTITSLEPIIQGTFVGLERGKPAQGPLFDALVERIASLFASHSLEELRKRQLDVAPVELVIDLDALLQTRFPLSERWEPGMLVDLLAKLPTDRPLAIYGVGPNWLYAAVAAHVHPQRFYLFDPRIGWVSPPSLQISLNTTAEIHVQTRADELFTILWVDIPKQYLDYSQSDRLPFPPIPPGRGLIIYGMIPRWLLTAIIRLYKAEVGWIACYLPQLSGAVIVASHMPDHILGELIPLRDAMADVLVQQGEPKETVALYEQVLQTYQELGDVRGMAVTQNNRANVLEHQGKPQEALVLYETKTLLVTVKTYPTPSAKYIETTCVSGITDDGHWIRLHPVNFRSLEDTYKFPRYSRIRVRVNKSTRDIRPESYHLDVDSIEQLGVIPTTNNWEQRRVVIEPLLSRSVEDLQDQNAAHGTSLGVIRPKEITRFLLQETTPSWSPEQLAKLGQQELFALRQIPQLEKIPFRFAYEFKCDDPRCHGHTMQVFDWEVAQAYRNWRQGKTRTEWEQMLRREFDYKVRHMYDSLLFLGTLAAHPKTWIIGGIFFAPTERPLPTLW